MKAQIETFLKNIDVHELNILDFINIDEIDMDDPFESIFEMIDDNCGFDVEIIYYTNACDYLKKYDPSFKDSIELAIQYDFNLNSLSSETLASLHASEKTKNDFFDYRQEIEDFFSNLN